MRSDKPSYLIAFICLMVLIGFGSSVIILLVRILERLP